MSFIAYVIHVVFAYFSFKSLHIHSYISWHQVETDRGKLVTDCIVYTTYFISELVIYIKFSHCTMIMYIILNQGLYLLIFEHHAYIM